MFTVYVFCYVLKYFSYQGIVTSYVNDLLSLPIVLSILLLLLRNLHHDPKLMLSHSVVIFALLYEMIVFEVVLPYFFYRFTADVFDIIAYGMGALLFVILQKRMK